MDDTSAFLDIRLGGRAAAAFAHHLESEAARRVGLAPAVAQKEWAVFRLIAMMHLQTVYVSRLEERTDGTYSTAEWQIRSLSPAVQVPS